MTLKADVGSFRWTGRNVTTSDNNTDHICNLANLKSMHCIKGDIKFIVKMNEHPIFNLVVFKYKIYHDQNNQSKHFYFGTLKKDQFTKPWLYTSHI